MWTALLCVLCTFLADTLATPAAKSSRTHEDALREMKWHVYNDIHQHSVMVFSKTYCPWSKRLKALLNDYVLRDYKIMELDTLDDMEDVQDYLEEFSGRHTVPQLYINGRFVGGFMEVRQKEDSGQLERLLAKVGAYAKYSRRKT